MQVRLATTLAYVLVARVDLALLWRVHGNVIPDRIENLPAHTHAHTRVRGDSHVIVVVIPQDTLLVGWLVGGWGGGGRATVSVQAFRWGGSGQRADADSPGT